MNGKSWLAIVLPRRARQRLLLLLLLVAVAALAPADARVGVDHATLWFRADIVLGPDGRLVSLAWRNYKAMPEAAQRSLEQKIRSWDFRPAPGVRPVESIATTLTIRVLAKERKDGKFGIEVEDAFTGPSLLDAPDQHGWQRWERIDMGTRPASAGIVYEVDWDGGEVRRLELVEYDASTSRREYRESQEARSREQILAWRVKPEQVDGATVEARFRFLYTHCVIPAWCASHEPRGFRGLPEVPRGDPVPLQSVVTIATDVRGMAL